MAMKFEQKGEGKYLLDVQGYVCPHPQLYLKMSLAKIKEGDVLELLFDNPSSSESIAAMCDNEGHDIFDKHKESGKYTWKIKKS